MTASPTKPAWTDSGIPVESDKHSLMVGPAPPILLQDHSPIEQMTQRNRERVPERQPYAEGSGAFGYSEVTDDASAKAGVGHAADAGTGRDPPGQARLRQLAEEQTALRRVATLVAGGARPAEVFGAVADELGRLIGAEATFVSRFDQLSGERGEIEGYATVVGSYGQVSDQARRSAFAGSCSRGWP
jgi:hypothetical protein